MNTLKTFAIICLAILLLLVFLDNKKLTKANATLTLANKTLKDNEQMRVEIDKGQIIVLNRTQNVGGGDSKPETEKRAIYTPPEGQAVISQDVSGKVTITNKNKGFCLSPAISGQAATDGEFSVGLNMRLFFWDRWGGGAGINTKLKPFAFIDRRIDDYVKFARNTTVGVFYDGSAGVFIGVFF